MLLDLDYVDIEVKIDEPTTDLIKELMKIDLGDTN